MSPRKRVEPPEELKSVAKAWGLLKLFTAQKCRWSVAEMVKALGYHESSVRRVVDTLECEGVLERVAADQRTYKLGPRLLALAHVAALDNDLQQTARPHLERLAQQTQETAHFCVVDQNQCYYLDKIDTPHSIRIVTHVGQRLPLHCTGVGKALMSGMDEREIDQIIAACGLPGFTPNTITDRLRLLEELEQIRKEGLSYDREEFEIGLRCLAAPVKDASGRVVAAVSISGPSQRITPEVIPQLAQEVKQAALEISTRLGYRSPTSRNNPKIKNPRPRSSWSILLD